MNTHLLIRLSSPELVPGLHHELAQGAKWFLRDQGEVEITTLGPFRRDGRGRSPAETSVLFFVAGVSVGGPTAATAAQQLEEILRARARVAGPDARVTVMWAVDAHGHEAGA